MMKSLAISVRAQNHGLLCSPRNKRVSYSNYSFDFPNHPVFDVFTNSSCVRLVEPVRPSNNTNTFTTCLLIALPYKHFYPKHNECKTVTFEPASLASRKHAQNQKKIVDRFADIGLSYKKKIKASHCVVRDVCSQCQCGSGNLPALHTIVTNELKGMDE